MTTKLLSNNGTLLTETEVEYRKLLIADSKSVYCPVTHKPISAMSGEIIFCNGKDYFISDDGIERLKGIFGDKAIADRIITYD